MFLKLINNIKNNKIFDKAYLRNIDISSFLDMRDEKEFDDEWIRVFDYFEDILIEEKSTLTQENIMYAKELMEYENIKTVIFVSDPLHMKRAMLIATAAGIEAYSSPTPTSRYVSLKSKLTFLKKEMILYTAYKILTRVSFYHSCYTLSYLY